MSAPIDLLKELQKALDRARGKPRPAPDDTSPEARLFWERHAEDKKEDQE